MAKGSAGTYIIYPEYFNVQLTRAMGRRVPKSKAILDPKLEDVLNVCRKLGLSPIMEQDKPHPAHWYDSRGRIKVIKRFSKETTLKMISERLAQKA